LVFQKGHGRQNDHSLKLKAIKNASSVMTEKKHSLLDFKSQN